MKKLIAILGLGFAALTLATAADARAPADTARAEADRLIAGSSAPELFANATDPGDGIAFVRHRASNFACPFYPGRPNKLGLVNGPLPRGDDIVCSEDVGFFQADFYITRVPDADLKTLFDLTVSAVNKVSPNLKPADMGTAEMGLRPGAEDEGPPRMTAWFTGERDGHQVFSVVSVVKSGEWMITMRATGPLATAGIAEGQVRMLWLFARGSLKDPPKP